MRKQHPAQLIVWFVAVLLIAGGTAYIGRGLWLPWHTNQDIDLKLRDDEHVIFMQHIYPHALVAAQDGHAGLTNYTIYPPYAFAIFTPLFSPPGYKPDRALFQILSIGALALMAFYGAQRLRFAGPATMALGAAIPLAFSGNFVALCQGQFSIISTSLIIAQIMLLEKDRPVAAGLCWSLAMIKPQIGAAFALLFLVGPRQNIRGLFSGAAILCLLSAAALIWTGTTPENLLINGWLSHHIGYMAQQNNAAGMWMGMLGLSPIQATVAIVAVLAIAAILLWIFGRHVNERLSLDKTAAFCAALGYAAFYHVHYDNMMLFPLLLALVAAGFQQRNVVLFTAAAMLGIICYTVPGILVGAAQNHVFVRWFIFLWPLASCAALLFAMHGQPLKERPAP